MGKGTFTWVNEKDGTKESYSGDYSNGKKHGYGEFRFKNGDIYKGNWSDNYADKEGIFEKKNKINKSPYVGGTG